MEAIVLLITVVGAVAAVAAAVFAWRQLEPRRWAAERRRFVEVRRHLQAERAELGARISRRYPDATRVHPDVSLLTRAEWLPARPIPLDSVRLELTAAPEVTATSATRGQSWPRTESGDRPKSYWEAVTEIDPPEKGVLYDASTYRFLSADLAGGDPVIRFGVSKYSDLFVGGESLGYEAARADLAGKRIEDPKVGLRARDRVDTWGTPRRIANSGVNTLTIRWDSDKAGFLMHDRRRDKLGSAEGVLHVAPAGEFQPTARTRSDQKAHFSLWLNIMREYNEEFLGAKDASGPDAEPVDIDSQPYAQIDALRGHGLVRPYLLGVGLDPLSLKAEILTVCVWSSSAFDLVFPGVKLGGDEGPILGMISRQTLVGYPFEKSCIEEFLADRTLPAGAACLALSLRWSEELLA